MNQKTVKKQEFPQPETIGPYSILRSIGRGGMGEVYLARDPACGRQLALKRIRPDLSQNQTIRKRFLREARVASQLSHPSIIPILSIEHTPPDVYYTMPYVEGDTLRQILRAAQEAKGNHPLGKSIPSLTRIFLQICEAIAYTHAKGILHRDLKPENIIVGKYGEVMILDWGIADFIQDLKNEDTRDDGIEAERQDLTRPGKIAGTLAYMAPERFFGKASSVQTDIYSLGVILYYMLTLQVPFQRKSLAAFRKAAKNERLIDPLELAPYRDIPHLLSSACCKCLASDPDQRFQSVEALLHEIKSYIEGQAQWIPMASLHPDRAEDWQFQENILLSKNIAITRVLDETDWAAVMISRKNFASNIKLKTRVLLKEGSQGIGLMLSMPSVEERRVLEEGYCLWVNLTECRLYRNNVQVFSSPHELKEGQWHTVSVEKVEDVLTFHLDGTSVFSYVSYLPLPGAHVGLLHKDSLFELGPIEVFDASPNAYVRCLAVPNAFLSHKLYDLALQEYRRIGQSFPGRQEGREALFRAGIALLEQGKSQRSKHLKEQYLHNALKEFGSLYRTSGAPLEYLGKSLVYDALGDPEEEAKCLELALRKFPKHPLISIVKDQIVYRCHESSQSQRDAAYRIILLAIRHMPEVVEQSATNALINSLSSNLELLPFLERSNDLIADLSIQLAFWLAKPLILGEIASSLAKRPEPSSQLIENALFSLLELEASQLLEKQLSTLPSTLLSPQGRAQLLAALGERLPPLPQLVSRKEARLVCHFLRKALQKRRFDTAEEIVSTALKRNWSEEDRPSVDALLVWFYCLTRNWKKAGKLFQDYELESLHQEQSPLHFAYGCWLYATEGPEIAKVHFSGVLDTPYPCTAALPSHFLLGRINGKKGWIERAFWWEKKELHRQLDFFYLAIGKKKELSLGQKK